MGWLTAPFHYQFMLTGFAAAVMIGLTCGTMGVYVVHRRMAFVGDALTHATLPGLVIALYFLKGVSVGALVAGVLTALGIGWISRKHKIKEDAAIGIAFTAMFAVGILLLALKNLYVDPLDLLIGNILSVRSSDLYLMAAVTGIVLLSLFLFHKELELTSCDPSHAVVVGISADFLRYLLLVLLSLVVVTGVQFVGVVLIIALLITPAVTASLLTHRLVTSMWIAAVIAILCSVFGLYLSFFLPVATGATIVLACTATFGIVWLVKSLRQSSPLPVANK